MSSPLARRSQELAAESRLPADNWLAKRKQTIEGHKSSVDAGLRALRSLGKLILDARISTDLRIEEAWDVQNTRPGEELGHISCSVIPSLSGLRPTVHPGRGYSWTPDVALQLNFVFDDRYDRTQRNDPRPTGDVQLGLHIRTWGRVTPKEIEEIGSLGDGTNTHAEYGDQGHHRNGTSILAIRRAGQIISGHEAETLLVPVATHILDYFQLVGRPGLAVHQQPGNFSSHVAAR